MRTRPYWVVLVFAVSIVCAVIGSPVLANPPSEARNPLLQGNNVSQMNLERGSDGMTVMTMNVYVGTDVDQILAAQDPAQIPILVALAFQEMLSTNFFERAEAIADQIQRTRPHLVGLQEISSIRVQSPGDAIIGGTIPATIVLFDYLDILMDALVARGLANGGAIQIRC